jgi:hypothetical protein
MQIAQAIKEAEQAVSLDPLSPWAHGHLSLVLVAARQHARGVEEGRTGVQLAPGLWWLRWFYGGALVFQGRTVLGLRECQKVYEEIQEPLIIGAMAAMLGLCRRRKQARELLSDLQYLARSTYVPPYALALAYLGACDDRVFEWLDRGIDARDPMATHLPSMPLYDGIRDDPRFRALLTKMHLA